jgi:hypothetical protein
MDDVLSSPLLGVIVGATLAYLMGIRTRRRERIDELFDTAIAKVAIMQASRIHPTKLGILDFPSDELKRLEDDFRVEGYRHFVRMAGECREALAAVHPYCPNLRPYWEKFEVAEDEVDEVIRILQECRGRRILRGRR